MKTNLIQLFRRSVYPLGFILLVMIAIPRDLSFIAFSNGLGTVLNKDVTMIGVQSISGVEGHSLFMPMPVERLASFNIPRDLASFIFPRDTRLKYSSGSLEVIDVQGQVLSNIPLGQELGMSFQKASTGIGSTFRIPRINSSTFIIALSGSNIQNLITLTNGPVNGNAQYPPLNPISVVATPESSSQKVASSSYKAVDDVINATFSFLHATSTERNDARLNYSQAIDGSIAIVSADNNLDDATKNKLLGAYTVLRDIANSNASDDGKYASILSGLQVELANQVLNSSPSVSLANNDATNRARSLTAGRTPAGSTAPSTVTAPATAVNVPDRTTQAATGSNAGTSSNSQQLATPAEPEMLIPAKAVVGATSVSVPCEATDGYLTHYLQNRECTGANIINIPMGIFSLVYNSVKSDDSFFSIQRVKPTFHEYITGDLKFFINSQDQKIPLVRSGNELRPSFVWGIGNFRQSGPTRFIREERQSGLRYIYVKVATSDPIFRLNEVQLLNNTKVLVLDYNTTAPFHIRSLEYRASKEDSTLRKINFSRAPVSQNGVAGFTLTIDYPSNETSFKDIIITSFNSTIASVRIGSDTFYSFRSRPNASRVYYPVALNYSASVDGSTDKLILHQFFGYDPNGRIVYREVNSFSPTGQKIINSLDYRYTQSRDGHYIITLDNFGKRYDEVYKPFSGNFLKTSYRTPYGYNLIEYRGSMAHFYRHYSARDKKWDAELLRLEDGRMELKTQDTILINTVEGENYTTVLKNLDNSEVLRSLYINKGNGEYAKYLQSGKIKEIETRSLFNGSADSYTSTNKVEVDGKLASHSNVFVSDTLVKVRDLISGEDFEQTAAGEITSMIYKNNKTPDLKNIISTRESGNGSISSSSVFSGNNLIAKDVSRITKSSAGDSWNIDSFRPKPGSQQWRQYSSSYNATNKRTEDQEMFSPVGGR